MLHFPNTEQILNEQLNDRNSAEFLSEQSEWNRDIATKLAAEEGIALTEEHWQLLNYLRRRFSSQGPARYSRILLHELEAELADNPGRRHLFELFPGGPVSQGCRIARIPAPPYHEDRSFGSVQ